MTRSFFQLLNKTDRDSAATATIQLLHLLHVRVTRTTIIETLEGHPDHPSLFSIASSLGKWGVEHLALETAPVQLTALPLPFIAHLTTGKGGFCVVTGIGQETIRYLDAEGQERSMSAEAFGKHWSGHVLLASAGTDAGEKNYAARLKTERINAARIPFMIASCILLVLCATIAHPHVADWPWSSLLLVLKLAGSMAAGLLLLFELDRSNPLLQQICTKGRHMDCAGVLQSAGARIGGLTSWSEIGFLYFTGSFLYLLVGGSGMAMAVTSWINLAALPFTLYSLWYQWRVVRKWCRLCLIVQALLLLEGITAYFGYWRGAAAAPAFSWAGWITCATCFLLPLFFRLLTKKAYRDAQQMRRYRREAERLKYDSDVFQALLARQKQAGPPPEGTGIVLGRPGARYRITKVCNPYCRPCAKAHEAVEELLAQNEDISVQIIFTATNEHGDLRAQPVQHLMALYEREDKELMKKALADWYGNNDYETFSARYQVNGRLQAQAGQIEAMDRWCRQTGIEFTPTFFINGRQLPEQYRIDQLKHLLNP